MIFPAFPIVTVDLTGSLLMIVFSLLSFERMVRLTSLERENLLWTYLLFVCAALSIFAVSRSAGHIVKQLLFFMEIPRVWDHIRPFSGSVNTLTFILVASVTLFFERVWVINRAIIRDRKALRKAHEDLFWLNRNLETLVDERTEALAISEKRYRRMFELSADMIVVTTGQGVFSPLIRRVRPCCKTRGATPEAALSRISLPMPHLFAVSWHGCQKRGAWVTPRRPLRGRQGEPSVPWSVGLPMPIAGREPPFLW